MTLFYTGIVGLLLLAPAMPTIWIRPDAYGLGLMALMGLTAVTGHYLIIQACHYAPASLVAPFNYVEIISATLLSLYFFNFLPDQRVWIGIAVICLSGIYISIRERKT